MRLNANSLAKSCAENHRNKKSSALPPVLQRLTPRPSASISHTIRVENGVGPANPNKHRPLFLHIVYSCTYLYIHKYLYLYVMHTFLSMTMFKIQDYEVQFLTSQKRISIDLLRSKPVQTQVRRCAHKIRSITHQSSVRL